MVINRLTDSNRCFFSLEIYNQGEKKEEDLWWPFFVTPPFIQQPFKMVDISWISYEMFFDSIV